MVAVTAVVPTWLLAGHESAARLACGQTSALRGLPITPAGRCRRRSRTCSDALPKSNPVVRSACALARVSLWVMVTFWGVIAAASAGRTARPMTASATSASSRRGATMVQAPANTNEGADTPVRGAKKPAQTDFYNTFLTHRNTDSARGAKEGWTGLLAHGPRSLAFRREGG